ncbi:MAG: rhomboid family intramembrane serine protease [Dethiobacteria bacterium]
MIPIRDSAPRRGFPIVNIAFIMVNFLVFLYQLTLTPGELQQFFRSYGTIPLQVTTSLGLFLRGSLPAPELLSALFPLISANFLHGGWLHLLGNMLYLWVFGDNIEGRLGHGSYLLAYLLMGAGSQMVHLLSDPLSPVPLVGASGAIAGVLGAYLILYPRSQILTLVPLGFFITFVRIPALVFLPIWFLLQLINATGAILFSSVQAVAWWAHVGGFIIGFLMARQVKKERPVY